MKKFPVATSAKRTKRPFSPNEYQPISKPQTQHQCTKTLHIALSSATSQEDLYQEHSSSTCTQENNGGSHGRYQHTHRIYDTVLPNNGPYQGNPHSSGRGGKFVSKTCLSKGHSNYFQICVKVLDLFSIITLIKITYILLQGDPQQQTEHTPQLSIPSWYIGLHKEQLQRSLQSRQPSYKMILT